MKKPFDIFWFGDSGPSWIEAVDTLEVAKAHIEKLPQAGSLSSTNGLATACPSRRKFKPVELGPVKQATMKNGETKIVEIGVEMPQVRSGKQSTGGDWP